MPDDDQCRAERPTRERIAAKYPDLLPWSGLLPIERRRDQLKVAWAALPDDDPRKLAFRSKSLRKTDQKPLAGSHSYKPRHLPSREAPTGIVA